MIKEDGQPGAACYWVCQNDNVCPPNHSTLTCLGSWWICLIYQYVKIQIKGRKLISKIFFSNFIKYVK